MPEFSLKMCETEIYTIFKQVYYHGNNQGLNELDFYVLCQRS